MNDNLSDNENIIEDNQEVANDSDDNEEYEESFEDGWIPWFVRQEGNEFLVEIPIDFIKNKSNLVGLEKFFKDLDSLIEIIIGEAPLEEVMNDRLMESLRDLYGLIHARYILTSDGLYTCKERFLSTAYGYCPRILCNKQALIPIGLSDNLKHSRVKVFCPKCEEIYKPRNKCSDIDGAYFGTSFPQELLITFPQYRPKRTEYKHYEPKLKGFRIHNPEKKHGKNGVDRINDYNKENRD